MNIFASIPADFRNEIVDLLAASAAVRIERIVSRGHVSPAGFWYDQPQNEFVLLVSGAARLRFEGDAAPLELQPGDYLTIAAHRRHRVDWTAPDVATVWLAVHYD